MPNISVAVTHEQRAKLDAMYAASGGKLSWTQWLKSRLLGEEEK